MYFERNYCRNDKEKKNTKSSKRRQIADKEEVVDEHLKSFLNQAEMSFQKYRWISLIFSICHDIPPISALDPRPGWTCNVSEVLSIPVTPTPKEIMFFCRVPYRKTVFLLGNWD